ncbi:FAD-dependent oxidoreductase [Hypericibacter adhaerens]|uniref:Pyridine nucleotide-disulfide oxidoreductase domain-containing protein 2 n=1 Tax=Hypericibacter adhaerens TaxID=2602016 RepID=A0A5J6N119_9PROT|nr:NAD(P)/FAD-dependent oxidoreductase [Hypericibacter adhaerens]QEX23177.1 FAD-dependent oxidoreductase [Hypericibacter adhaerens]
MSANQYDAIVIGAGHNGLVTAAYLGKAGLRTLVVEANERPGGAAVTREFAPGFKTSAVAHLLHALHPRVIRELGLEGHGLKPRQHAAGTTALLPGGGRIDISGDVAATAASIGKVSHADGEAWAPVMARLVRLSSALGDFLLKTPPSPAPGSNDFQTKLALGMFALKLRMLGKKDMLELSRILTINVADLANDFFESDAIKGLLSLEATLGVYLGPRSPNTVFNLLYRLSSFGKNGLGGFYLPAGGMGSVVEALVKAATVAGVTLRTGAPVEHLLIEKEIATGVVLKSGEEIRAPIVASSADPQRTLLHLVPPGNLDIEFSKRIRHLRMNGCVAKIHLAMDGLPEALKASGGRVVVAPSIDHVEHAFDDAKYGRVAEKPALEIVIPTLADPGLAPAGKHVLSMLFQYAPYRLRNTPPDQARAQVFERGLALLEEMAPGTRGLVRAAETLTPHDLETQFGLSGGQWHQGEVTLDQVFFLRPAASFQRYRMPVPGLWLCGAGVHPGGNVSGAAGANAAREILKDLKARKGGRVAA